MIQCANKINILFIMMQMEMGGSERLVHSLVLRLDRNIFNPAIAWFYGDKIVKDFADLNVPLYHVPKVKRFDFSTMQKMEKIITDNSIHIVNAHHFMSMVYAFHGCKIVNHAKLIYTEHSEWEINKISWIWRRVGSYLLSRSDAVVGVSAGVSKQMQNTFKIDNSKTFTIQNGVNCKDFANNKKSDVKEKLDISNNEKVIGMTANLKKIKNHLFLLKAFNELIKDYKNVKLLIIGQGFEGDAENTEHELKNYVYEQGLRKNVLFLGYRSDIRDLLGILDVFCLTSFKEGLPISLIEAMAAGLPVVGTDVEGIREVIIPNRNGFLVPIDDVMGLKRALYTLIQNETLRKKYCEESKILARDTYSLDKCVKQYQHLFLSLM